MFDLATRALPWLALGLLGACAAVSEPAREEELPEVMISGLVMFNQGQAYVSAARVLVPASGQFVSCGNIAPRSRCATGFPEQRYSGNPIEITWSQGGSIFSTGELQLSLPDEVIEAGQATVQVWIMGPGSAAAELAAKP